MYYIRLKNGKIIDLTSGWEIDFETEDYYSLLYYDKDGDCIDGFMLSKKDILKQADTIEELCDEFICTLKEIPTTWCAFDIYEIRDELETHPLNEWDWYGAILTNKGIIYKVKMKGILPNGEIDWELL